MLHIGQISKYCWYSIWYQYKNTRRTLENSGKCRYCGHGHNTDHLRLFVPTSLLIIQQLTLLSTTVSDAQAFFQKSVFYMYTYKIWKGNFTQCCPESYPGSFASLLVKLFSWIFLFLKFLQRFVIITRNSDYTTFATSKLYNF